MNIRIFFIVLATFSMLACQTRKVKVSPGPSPKIVDSGMPSGPSGDGSIHSQTPESPQMDEPEPSVTAEEEPRHALDLPKIGLILGPGGARAFAHIGVIQELQREKIPIHSIAGLEFGAPMAALFAWKGFANDVEWQMMKLKTEPFQKRGASPQEAKDFLEMVFQKTRVEEEKLPFACLANNLAKKQLYVMSRGSLSQLIPYCWPYPPMMKPYRSNISGLRDTRLLSSHLRAQGANFIVYVNVLAGKRQSKIMGDPESLENIVWQEVATSLTGMPEGVDHMINLNLEEFDLLSFDKRRDIVKKGSSGSLMGIRRLAQKLNL